MVDVNYSVNEKNDFNASLNEELLIKSRLSYKNLKHDDLSQIKLDNNERIIKTRNNSDNNALNLENTFKGFHMNNLSLSNNNAFICKSPDLVKDNTIHNEEATKLLLSNKEEKSSNIFHSGSLKYSIDEAYSQLNLYSNFNRFTSNAKTKSTDEKRKICTSYTNKELSRKENFDNISLHSFKDSFRKNIKNKNKIIENNDISFHRELGSKLYSIKKENKAKEFLVNNLKNKIKKIKISIDANHLTSNSLLINNEHIAFFNRRKSESSSTNASTGYFEHTNLKNTTTDRINQNTSILTSLDQKALLRKYKGKNVEELKERKKELQLERIRRKDEIMQSQMIKEKEKKRNFQMIKEKSKNIENLIHDTSKVKQDNKSIMSSTIKVNNKESLQFLKVNKIKNKEKVTVLYKQKIDQQTEKQTLLNQELTKLKEYEEHLISKCDNELESTIINNTFEDKIILASDEKRKSKIKDMKSNLSKLNTRKKPTFDSNNKNIKINLDKTFHK